MEEQLRFGTLVVIVDKARNLPNRKRIGKQDAYAIVRLGHDVQKTPTDKRAGQVPSWNHEIRFGVSSESEKLLKISIFNEDSKTPEMIGDCAIDLTELYRSHEFDSWFDLKYKDKPAGEVYVELTFYYEGPPKPNPKVQLSSEFYDGRPSTTQPRSRHGSASMGGFPAMYRLDSAEAAEQEHLSYAKTWNGVRDNRIITPAPGDIRRNRTSLDESSAGVTPAPIRYRATFGPDYRQPEYSESRVSTHQRESSTSEGRLSRNTREVNSFGHNSHRGPRANSRSETALEFAHTYQVLPRDGYPKEGYPTDQNYGQPRTYSPHREDLPEVSHKHLEDDEYVEAVLDPRYGSQFEMRDSIRIVSPHPEYPSGYRQSPILDQGSFDDSASSSPEFVRQQSKPNQAIRQAREYVNDRRFTPSVEGIDSHADQYRHHNYAHSYSQSDREPHQALFQSAHSKSASTSAVHMQNHLRSGNESVPREDRHAYRPGEAPRVWPQYVNELTYQRPSTFAVTPAQHVIHSRPLPAAPGAGPARPAKIPLGLTQEEYDILNGY